MSVVPSNFRLNAKHFRLTFPQTDITKQELYDHLLAMQPEFLSVAQELHQDGHPHLHASISFKTRKNVRSSTHFDIPEKKHGNILKADFPEGWDKYISKFDPIPLTHGQRSARASRLPLTQVPTEELFQYSIDNRIGYGYYNEERRRRETVDPSLTEENKFEGIMSWYLQCLELPMSLSIILTGSTGIGKTTWAMTRCPKPSLLISHLDQLRQFRAEYHKSIVFDDMSFHHQPVTAQIHLVDHNVPRAIHIRYGIITLPANLVKIFTCNEYPFTANSAIQRRVRHINADGVILIE